MLSNIGCHDIVVKMNYKWMAGNSLAHAVKFCGEHSSLVKYSTLDTEVLGSMPSACKRVTPTVSKMPSIVLYFAHYAKQYVTGMTLHCQDVTKL